MKNMKVFNATEEKLHEHPTNARINTENEVSRSPVSTPLRITGVIMVIVSIILIITGLVNSRGDHFYVYLASGTYLLVNGIFFVTVSTIAELLDDVLFELKKGKK